MLRVRPAGRLPDRLANKTSVLLNPIPYGCRSACFTGGSRGNINRATKTRSASESNWADA